MWTCAFARGVVERFAAEGETARVVQYACEFVGMVHCGDELAAQLVHAGITGGRKIVTVAVAKVETGEVVLRGRAEVEQPKTAYLFTGQGGSAAPFAAD
jgi:fatty acid synthase subunit beta